MRRTAELRQPGISAKFETLPARGRDRSESVPAFRSKPFAGSLGGLPDGLIRIVGADDGEEAVSLTKLPGFLACEDRSETWIVIERLQIGLIREYEMPVFRRFGNQLARPRSRSPDR